MTRDDFEEWLVVTDLKLDALFDSMPSELAKQLDYSPSALSVLERWLLDRYSSITQVLSDSQKYTLDQLGRYVGEAFRKTMGGIWNVDLENVKSAYYGLPVIQRQDGWWVVCPVTLVTASTDRRTGTYMESVLRHMMTSYRDS